MKDVQCRIVEGGDGADTAHLCCHYQQVIILFESPFYRIYYKKPYFFVTYHSYMEGTVVALPSSTSHGSLPLIDDR
jgi:hypothetical protein